MRQSNLKVKFVTNTTKEPLRTLHEKLTKLNFDIKKEEIFTSLTAARGLVETRNVRPLLLLEETAKEDFAGRSNCVYVFITACDFKYQEQGHPIIKIFLYRYA